MLTSPYSVAEVLTKLAGKYSLDPKEAKELLIVEGQWAVSELRRVVQPDQSPWSPQAAAGA